jgi:hypothetical protein
MLRLALTLVMALGAVGAAGAWGRLESTSRDLGDFDRVRLTTGSIEVEVSDARDGARLEATLDSRRTLTVAERDGELVIGVSGVVVGFAGNEVIHLFVPRNKAVQIGGGSGSVKIADVEFDELTVRVGSGSIRVIDCQGLMSLEAGSGHIEVERISGTLKVTAGSGSILGEAVTPTGDSSFKTGSGSIEMQFLNAEDQLSFDLDAGSGSIRIGDIKGADRVIYGAGQIKITGRSGSGSQNYTFR